MISEKDGRPAAGREGSEDRHQTIERRIERRLEVLRSWLRDGVPEGKCAPRNLKQARLWKDPDLNILPIASPNEFTTTHHLHGALVQDVARLLTALRHACIAPASRPRQQPPASLHKFDRRAFDRQLAAVVSQWHEERDRRVYEEKRADAAEARAVMLLEEAEKKDILVADLRHQIAAREGLRVVK